ncbi:MAG: DoxX family protein [Pseudomonadota bacterium]
MSFLLRLQSAHTAVFRMLDRLTEGWFLTTLARFLFLLVLFDFFFNSAMTKLGDGFFGFLTLSDGAYWQIVPGMVQAAGFQPGNVGFLGDLIVFFGTWSEIILPILIVAGLFTRLSAIGMIGFIVVMTWVDLSHGTLTPEAIGTFFDPKADGLWDRRVLWVFLLLVLAVKGPGPLSLDRLFGWLLRRRVASQRSQPAAVTMEEPSH